MLPPKSLATRHAENGRALMVARAEAEAEAARFRAEDPFEQAARQLRSRGYPVFRAEVSGGKAGHWVVGSRTLSAGGLIEMARRVSGAAARNAPPAPAISGEAPLVLASAVRDGGGSGGGRMEEASMVDKYRGVGADVVLELLQALRARFDSVRAFADVLGVPESSLGLVLNGRKTPTAAMVSALFGPDGSDIQPRWLELLAGGPVLLPTPEPEATSQAAPQAIDNQDSTVGDAGSEASSPSDAVEGAGETPPLAPAPDITAPASVQTGPGIGETHSALTPDAEPPVSGPAPATVVDGSRAVDDAHSVSIGVRAAPYAIDTDGDSTGAGEGSALQPWAGLEDRDLVSILNGVRAGLRADRAALEAEDDALLARRRALNLELIEIEVREAALGSAIEAFTPDTQATDIMEEADHGNEGAAEAA